VISWWP